MGLTPAILKKHGCGPEAWKKLFVAEPSEKLKPIKRLELLIQNRLNDGKLWNFANYRPFAAIDIAYNASFYQTTPTIINYLIGKDWSKSQDKQQEMLAELQRWGINVDELFLDATSPMGQPCRIFNPPTFYRVFVPLVQAYVKIRWAKLFNDRNADPLFPYNPMQPNDENRILCDTLTYLLQVRSADYGYRNVLKNVIFQSLMYSTCLAFPREVWDAQYHVEMVDGKEKRILQKEGIRYDLPHPTRMFYDLHHPIDTFNTDTGCEWAGYWQIVRYGDVLANRNYWNRKKIGYSGRNWTDPSITSNFFQEVYPCQLQWPTPINPNPQSRERSAAFYASNQRDMAVFLSELWMKLAPKDYALGTYPEKVWVRFLVASDDTVIYAEPCCYSPVLYCGYDSTSLQAENSSLALEVLPFQDIVGNIFSQILLTAKQNLANVNFYDKNVLSREDIDKIKNGGELMYRSMNFVATDSLKMARAGLDAKQAIFPFAFQNKDIQPLFQAMGTVLSMLERLLQISAQEAGSQATHQQSKAEIELLGTSTSTRVAFTGSFIDDFSDAFKRQQYNAEIAYMDDPVIAFISADLPNVVENLKKLGFTMVGDIPIEGNIKVSVRKKILKVDALASSTTPLRNRSDQQTSQVMMQAILGIAGNQELLQSIGVKPILQMMEKASILAGADKDFRLRPDQKQELNRLQAMAQQIQIAVTKQVEETVTKPAAQQMAKMQAEIEQLDKAMEALITRLGLAAAQPPQPAPQPALPPNAPIPQAQPIVQQPAGPAQLPVA